MHDRHHPATSFFERFRTSYIAAILVAAAAGLASGCARSEITAPETPSVGQLNIDASQAWAYVSLDSGVAVSQTDPASSTTWDIGFNATSVQLNGGANGPGDVTGFCICQNADATNDQVLEMTPENQDSAFTAVTTSSIPSAADEWTSDVFTTDPWYRYDLAGDHRISPAFEVYLVKRGAAVYKLQLINYYGPTGETRQIAVRYSKVRG
jgi:hypothetical protein